MELFHISLTPSWPGHFHFACVFTIRGRSELDNKNRFCIARKLHVLFDRRKTVSLPGAKNCTQAAAPGCSAATARFYGGRALVTKLPLRVRPDAGKAIPLINWPQQISSLATNSEIVALGCGLTGA